MSDRDNKDLQRIKSFQRELASDPASLVFVALAEALNRQKRFDEAVRVAEDGLKYHEDLVPGHLALAVALAGIQDIHGSIERIKTALSIDDENPKALALMGTLLLEKGLAHRSVQFFQQAVRVAPDRQEYRDLLRRARRLSQFSQNSRPAIGADQAPSARVDPWKSRSTPNSLPAHQALEDVDEGTEFEVDRSELFSNDESATVDQARLEDLKPAPALVEATQYASVQDMLGEADPAGNHLDAFSSTPPPNTTSKLRMGGSAAQPKHPLTNGAVPNFQDISDLRTRALPQDVAMGREPLSQEQTPTDKPAANRQVPASFEAPSVRRDREREKAKSGVQESLSVPRAPTPATPSDGNVVDSDISETASASSSVSSFEDKSAKMKSSAEESSEEKSPKAKSAADKSAKMKSSEEKSSEEKSPKAKSEKPVRKKSALRNPTPFAKSKAKAPTQDIVVESPADVETAEKRPATMFVDDAVWAIYGADRPEEKSQDDSKQKDKSKSKDTTAKPKSRRRSVLVVRTSEVFGKIIKGLAVGIAVLLAAFGGFQLATRNSSTANSQFVENVRGIVTDITTGSLGSLQSALEVVRELSENDPRAAKDLSDAKAEIHALLWSRYGRLAKHQEQVFSILSSKEEASTSLEAIHARIIMDKLAWSHDEVEGFLSVHLENHPDAVKPRVLKSKLYTLQGRGTDALENLVSAYQLDPSNREVLLELANWEGRASNFRAMLKFLEEILEQDAYRDDVEALLNSVVLAHILNDERKMARLQSRLVGVVRDEGVAVDKDEIGRASLVFAVLNLVSRDFEQSLENLESSEMTYTDSFEFKLATASVWFLMGDFTRAKKQVEAARKLEPDNSQAMLLASRIEFAELAKISFSSKNLFSSRKVDKADRAVTKLGQVTLVPSRFTFLDFEFNPELFPENAYARVVKQVKGDALKSELSATNFYHAAKRFQALGKYDLAKVLLNRLLKKKQSPDVFAALGSAYLGLGRTEDAIVQFDKALELDSSNLEAVYGKAKVLAAGNDFLAAIELIETSISEQLISPTITIFLARLHKERGSDAKELNLLETLKDIAPDSSIYLTSYGRSLHSNGRRSDALKSYSKALTLDRSLGRRPVSKNKGRGDSRTAVDYLYLGRVLAEKSAARAKQMFSASIKAANTPEEAHYFLGQLLVKKRATRRMGKRSLKLYLRNMPAGEFARDAKRLMRRK